MASFSYIRTDDPLRYGDQIVRFWEAYLPGTPSERLKWMQTGNPAGPSSWFLAFEKGSDEIVGTMTIMPRRIYYRGRELRTGILGDFMVDAKYRVFGPNLMLMRTSTDALDDLGLSFLYTVPNESSRKVAERIGIKYITELDCYARPLNFRFYLEKRLPGPAATILAPVVGALFRISSRETWCSFDGTVEETQDVGDRFDTFWQRLRDVSSLIIGDRSAEYLRWRYQDNPLYRFRFLVCRKKGDREISGYAVFCTREENKIDIYDMQATNGGCLDGLVRRLTAIGRAEGSQALYYIAPKGSPLFERLKMFRFIDTRDTLQLGFYGDPDIPLENWDFTNGDRNI